MRNSIRGILAGGFALLTLAALPSSGFQVGEPFPDIFLPNLVDGSPGSIGQFRGQKLLLHIFASW